ncbi:MAG: hypothetical protein ACXAEF_01170 [Candidatus Thorarchaeota archaeon]|jgi:hypothetical protein
MSDVRMDALEWIDVILIAIFPLLGIILFILHKNAGEEDRATASIWGMLIALIIYIPLNLILPWIGTFIAFAIIIVMFMLNKEGKLLVAPPEERRYRPGRIEDAKVIPSTCPNCNASLSHDSVVWIDNNTMQCPYCESTLNA